MKKDFERFSVYGFSIDYPKDARVEFNPKARRGEGDIVFHFPDKARIFLSWGDLEKARKTFGTVEKHADRSLDRVKKTRNVKNFELISNDSIRIKSHRGSYNRARFDEIHAGFLSGNRTTPREAHSVHVHCPDSSRYFILYALLPVGGVTDYEKIFVEMAKTVKCH